MPPRNRLYRTTLGCSNLQPIVMSILVAKLADLVQWRRGMTAKVPKSSTIQFPLIVAARDFNRSTVYAAARRGELRQLAPGLFTTDLITPADELVTSRLLAIVSALYPGAVITDRSARTGGRPAEDGSLFIVHERTCTPRCGARSRSAHAKAPAHSKETCLSVTTSGTARFRARCSRMRS